MIAKIKNLIEAMRRTAPHDHNLRADVQPEDTVSRQFHAAQQNALR